MAFINKGKHIEKEIGEVRIRVVDDAATKERMEFLTKLLEHNGYEVLSEELPPKPVPVPPPIEGEEPKEPKEPEFLPPTWLVGVTDITFNSVVMVYQRRLRTFEGQHVTPDYWNQRTTEAEPNYWDLSKKK
jgi:hypothetical protein